MRMPRRIVIDATQPSQRLCVVIIASSFLYSRNPGAISVVEKYNKKKKFLKEIHKYVKRPKMEWGKETRPKVCACQRLAESRFKTRQSWHAILKTRTWNLKLLHDLFRNRIDSTNPTLLSFLFQQNTSCFFYSNISFTFYYFVNNKKNCVIDSKEQ